MNGGKLKEYRTDEYSSPVVKATLANYSFSISSFKQNKNQYEIS